MENPSFLQFFFQSDLQTLEVVTKCVFHNLILGKVTIVKGMESKSPYALQKQV